MIAEPRTLREDWIEARSILPKKQEILDSFIDEKTLLGSWIEKLYDVWANGSVIDLQGNVWLDSDQLHGAIHVSSLADLALFSAADYETLTFESREFLRGANVAKAIDLVRTNVDREKGEGFQKLGVNAEVSKELYLLVRNSVRARRRQHRLYASLQEQREELRKKRTRKDRTTTDILTKEPIRHSEFVYVRSPSLYRELMGNPTNGLIVNRTTSDMIRANHVCDERDLFNLCKKQKWSTTWYKTFVSDLKSPTF